MVTSFTCKASLVTINGCNFELSTYRGNRPTNKQTNKQTHRQGRLQYTVPQLSVQCNKSRWKWVWHFRCTGDADVRLGNVLDDNWLVNYWFDNRKWHLAYKNSHTQQSRRKTFGAPGLIWIHFWKSMPCLHFNGHLPPDTRMSPLWILLELRVMEVVSGDSWSCRTR